MLMEWARMTNDPREPSIAKSIVKRLIRAAHLREAGIDNDVCLRAGCALESLPSFELWT